MINLFLARFWFFSLILLFTPRLHILTHTTVVDEQELALNSHSIPLMRCEGNLGDNLFVDGDFGSGSANIPPADPGIAPGYTYARQGPPSDGLYLLTNNTGAWPNLYPTWIRIRDNSDDPNGYMMVVNASYEPGIFYRQEISGLCANTTFEFSADVINLIARNVTDHIRPNISFYINDELKFSSGDIPQDESWKTYGFTFTTGPTETSLILSIRNNAPGGIGNDLALDNISFRPCGPEAIVLPEADVTVCEDEDAVQLRAEIFNSSYAEDFVQWQISTDGGANFTDIPGATGRNYTITDFTSGEYFYRYLVAGSEANLQNFKCRVFSYPKLVTVVPKFYTVFDTICRGLVYQTPTNSYTESGAYTDQLISSIGCDSIVTLNLTVIDDPMIRAETRVDGPSCFGIDDAVLTVELRNGGYPPYTFELNDNVYPGQQVFPALGPGEYTLRIADRFGCGFIESTSISYPPELTVDVGPDTTLPLGSRYIVPGTASYPDISYQWTSPLELSCSDCPQPAVFATGNGVIALEVTNAAGCTATDSLFFAISTEDSYRVYIPNVFSPNGDGVNDRFVPYTNEIEVETIETFQIFDRWGNLIFDQNDILPNDRSQGWDGQYRNRPVSTGVYLYRFNIRFIDDTRKTFTGAVTIIR